MAAYEGGAGRGFVVKGNAHRIAINFGPGYVARVIDEALGRIQQAAPRESK